MKLRDKGAAEQKKDALVQQWRQQQATLQQIPPSESDIIEESQEDKGDKEGKDEPYKRDKMKKDGSTKDFRLSSAETPRLSQGLAYLHS